MLTARKIAAGVAAVALVVSAGVFAGTDDEALPFTAAAASDACHQSPGSAPVNGHYVAAAGETWNQIAAKVGTTGSALRAVNLNASPSGLNTALPAGACLHVATDPTGGTTSTTTSPSSTVPAGSSTSSSAPATTQPSATTTSGPPSSTTAPTTTAPTPTTSPNGGTSNETFASDLSGWVTAHARPQVGDDCVPVGGCPTSIAISGGALRIVNGEQDYGDATARSLTKYDLTNGGTVSLDISDNGGGNNLVGSAYIMFSAGPQDAKHQNSTDDRAQPYCVPFGSTACIPTEGVTVWLRDNCRVPNGPPIVVVYPAMTTHHGACAADPDPDTPGNQIIDGKLQLSYAPGHLSIRNGANAEIVAYDVTLPSVGYLTLGVHNHASIKYSGAPDVTGTFDNVTYPTGGTTSTTVSPSSSVPAPSTSTTPPSTTSTTSSTSTTSTGPASTSSAPPNPTTTPASSGSFSESFTSPNGVARFDFQLHTASQAGGQPTSIATSFIGEHDLACGGPTTHRTVNAGQTASTFIDASATELFWYCAPGGDPLAGHLMSGLDTTGIAYLSFSPKQTFTNVTQVCWFQNMNDLGGAKWINVFVVPVSDVAAHGGNLGYLSVQGEPFEDSPIATRQFVPANSFHYTWLRGSTFAYQGRTKTMDFWNSAAPGDNVPPEYKGFNLDPAPRFQTCLNSGGDLVIHRPDGRVDTRNLGATFPTGQVRVIFQDASYNPTKHDGFADHLTWHWDNISITAE